MILAITLIVIILVLIWLLRTEKYMSWMCTDCEVVNLPKRGLTVLNPYVWPYDGESCLDLLYAPKQEPVSITHLSTPDHALSTN